MSDIDTARLRELAEAAMRVCGLDARAGER